MFRRFLALIGLGVAVTLTISLTGCGSSSSTGPKTQKDGRIFLQNDTKDLLRVNFIVEGEAPVFTEVQIGDKKEISGGQVLKAGTKAKIEVTSVGSPDYREHTDYPSSQKIDVTVDGNQIVRVYGKLLGGSHIDYEVIKED